MWKFGTYNINGTAYHYEIKIYETRSEFGIDGSRISKLWISENCIYTVCRYDRGWDVYPKTDDAKTVYKKLIEKYN